MSDTIKSNTDSAAATTYTFIPDAVRHDCTRRLLHTVACALAAYHELLCELARELARRRDVLGVAYILGGFQGIFHGVVVRVCVQQQTPRPVVDVLTEVLQSTQSDTQVSEMLTQVGYDRLALAPEALESFSARERVRMDEQVSRCVRPARLPGVIMASAR